MGWLSALVAGFVKGLLEPLLARWTAVRQGRAEQRADDLAAGRAAAQAVQRAVEDSRVHHPRVDADWLRRGGGAAASPAVPGDGAPPADP